MDIVVYPHCDLHACAFRTEFPAPIGQLATPPSVQALLSGGGTPEVSRPEALYVAIRQMLRHGGFKPSGRSKPSSEYLANALASGRLPAINVAVDVCNAVSLHSGLPISVLDMDRLQPPLSIAVAAPGHRYVFNASGQEIDVGGLVCLHDAAGPCGNAVKDAQRAKTDAATRSTLTVIWGCQSFADHVQATQRWYRQMLGELGAVTEDIPLRPAL